MMHIFDDSQSPPSHTLPPSMPLPSVSSLPSLPRAVPVSGTSRSVPRVLLVLAVGLGTCAILAVFLVVFLTLPSTPATPRVTITNPYDLPTSTMSTGATPTLTTSSATPVPTATPPFPVFCVNQSVSGCAQCPYSLGAETETQTQIVADLIAAAKTYHVPYRLVLGITHNESDWREMIVSCSDDVGLGQIKWIYRDSLNMLAVPECNIVSTTYDVLTYAGNANLTAKLIAWIACYFAYNGGNGGTLAHPAQYTAAWYYAQAHRSFPDIASPWHPIGTPTASLCATAFAQATVYKDLPSTEADPWSCPFTAKAGDHTLLDLVISAYNEGITDVSQNGIHNPSYITDIERLIVDFANQHI